jgi:ATP-binding cassette, subfamily A (ABC1), member 3
LELSAAIKGIPKDKREQLISKKIKEKNLNELCHISVGTYSGENKRKL